MKSSSESTGRVADSDEECKGLGERGAVGTLFLLPVAEHAQTSFLDRPAREFASLQTTTMRWRERRSNRRQQMPESAKDLQGRVKEAAGDLTDDSDLKNEGKVEQVGEKVKSGIDDVAEKAKDVLGKDKD
jgi:uncharacterized protein YjbJ (UPF0337 family)